LKKYILRSNPATAGFHICEASFSMLYIYALSITLINVTINFSNKVYKYFMINLTILISKIDIDQYNRQTLKNRTKT